MKKSKYVVKGVLFFCVLFLVTVGLFGCGKTETKNASNSESSHSEFNREIQNLDMDSFINLQEIIIKNDFVVEKDLKIRKLNAAGQYDLNMDGKMDFIDIKLIGREDSTLQINDNKMPISCEIPADFYLVDLIADDAFVELAIYDDGPSGDPITAFYRYNGTTIYKLGSFNTDINMGDSIYLYYGNVLTDKKGVLIPPDSIVKFVTPNIIKGYYSIENNEFVYHSVDYTECLGKEYVLSSDFEAYFIQQEIKKDLNMQDIPFTWDAKEAVVLKKGEKIKVLNIGDFWYGIERQDGTTGILYFWIGD